MSCVGGTQELCTKSRGTVPYQRHVKGYPREGGQEQGRVGGWATKTMRTVERSEHALGHPLAVHAAQQTRHRTTEAISPELSSQHVASLGRAGHREIRLPLKTHGGAA